MVRKGMQLKIFVLSSLCLFSSSCTFYSDLYDWGSYDQSVTKILNADQKEFLINEEIEILATELAQTRPERIPPGKTAHLGYLYALKGDSKTAIELFKQEKVLFPESTVFMNKLITLTQNKKLSPQ